MWDFSTVWDYETEKESAIAGGSALQRFSVYLRVAVLVSYQVYSFNVSNKFIE
jgi:hypothetical protein